MQEKGLVPKTRGAFVNILVVGCYILNKNVEPQLERGNRGVGQHNNIFRTLKLRSIYFHILSHKMMCIQGDSASRSMHEEIGPDIISRYVRG